MTHKKVFCSIDNNKNLTIPLGSGTTYQQLGDLSLKRNKIYLNKPSNTKDKIHTSYFNSAVDDLQIIKHLIGTNFNNSLVGFISIPIESIDDSGYILSDKIYGTPLKVDIFYKIENNQISKSINDIKDFLKN